MVAGVQQGSRSLLCLPFPDLGVPYPFSELVMITEANASGDRLVVGRLAIGLDQISATLPETAVLNQRYCDQVAVGPGTRWLLGWRQARGRTAGVRDAGAPGLLGGAFDQLARTVEVRRIDSHRTPGRYNIPSVGMLVWRLKPYSVSWTGMGQGVPKPQPGGTPANCLEEQGPQCYTFSVLGNDSPLFNRPQPEKQPTEIAGELNLPTPIRRLGFAKRRADYYGLTKSLAICAPNWPAKPSSGLAKTGRLLSPCSRSPKESIQPRRRWPIWGGIRI